MTEPYQLPEPAIAVVGMDGRFPGATTIAQFWENLCAGREGVRFFKPEELDPSIPASLRDDPKYVSAKGVVDDADKFDAAFFGISPIEAQLMDPQHRLMLELAWSTLEDAGHPAGKFPGLIGVFAGMNWNRYRANVAAHPEIAARFGDLNTSIANEAEFLATRLSYKLNLRGPSVTVGTACSTSLVAIAQAAQSLLNFECDLALAGGVSIAGPSNAGYLYQDGSMLSADGHTRSFDVGGTGTTFGEGAGLVALRRLSDALADGDRIYAVIRGFATNNDGADKVSFTAPSVAGQEAVIRAALDFAAVDPSTIGFVEAHGTATPLGDPIEVAALKRVFGDGARVQKCVLGSVKSNIGHAIHAAGVAGFIKAALAVHHGRIPPTLFFTSPNPRAELDQSPFLVNPSLIEWEGASPRRAGVSSFGVGGTNAHVVIEQAPPERPARAASRPRVLCLSAKTKEALAEQQARLAKALAATGAPAIDDVAYTLVHGRDDLPVRAAVPVRSAEHAVQALAEPRSAVRGTASRERKLAFLFTGQGSQRRHMGQWLYENDVVYRRHFDAGADQLRARMDLDLRQALFGGRDEDWDVDQTRIAQPALFLLEYSLARTLEAHGLAPDVLIGHSVGEFVAAALAGVLPADEALYLVARRGEAMQRLPRGSMLAINAGEAEAARFLSADVQLAAANAPELTVLSGTDAAIGEVEKILSAGGSRFKRLRTSHAFHSAMMDPAVDALREIIGGVSLAAPRVPIISTVTGQRMTDAEATNPDYWARQLRAPVRFASALDSLATLGEFVTVEVGPGGALTTLALQHTQSSRWIAQAALPGAGADPAAATEVLAAVGAVWANGGHVDWSRQFADVTPRRVSVPTYPFARVRHWLDLPAAAPVASTVMTAPQALVALPNISLPMPQASRRDTIEQRVIKVLEETSGYDLATADRAASFSELGFDSLLLTQVSTSLRREFAVEVTFRALLEDIGSIGELATHLDGVLPADAGPVAMPAAAVAVPAMPVAGLGMPNFAAVSGAGVPSDVSALIEGQLAIMRMQLQLLAGGGMAPASAPVPVAAVAPASPVVTPAAPAAAASADGAEAAAPRKHTPGTRIERSRDAGKQLTKAQQAFVDNLIESYVKATPGSKAFTRAHRRHLADPRTVSGFNPLWKEMVYPIVTNRSKGSRLWDVDGREYVDFTNGFGPIFFGHSPEFISEAVVKQIHEGIETGPQSPLAGEVAEMFCEMTGNERVAFTNTGSEAILAAIRLARTVTNRDKVVMFEGSYHGIIDEVVVRAGKGGQGLPATPGVPRSHTQNMIVLPYGTPETLETIRKMAPEIAAILVETVQSRHPGLQPVEFIRELRGITEQSGAALVFDEVVTGFRTHPGGMQAMLDIRADMAVYGKVVAGGYPIGLLAGKSRFLDALDGGQWQYGDDSIPEVGVTFFAGTFVRHPVALAAMKAVMLRLKEEGPQLQAGLGARTARLCGEIREFLSSINANVTIEEYSSYFYLSVGPGEPYGSLLFYLMRLHGVHAWEFRPQFITTSHSDADLALFRTAVTRSVSELVAHGLLSGDAVALQRLSKTEANTPPVAGARLGKDQDGAPAWFVPDPDRPGKFRQVGKLVS